MPARLQQRRGTHGVRLDERRLLPQRLPGVSQGVVVAAEAQQGARAQEQRVDVVRVGRERGAGRLLGLGETARLQEQLGAGELRALPHSSLFFFIQVRRSA